MRMFDSHCHLQDERLAAALEAVMARAREAGAAGFACCGTEESDWDGVAAVTARFGGVVSSYGLHPWYLGGRSAAWKESLVRRLAAHPKAGVGEIGLDHAIEPRNDDDQTAVFMDQLTLARELSRPASVHCRRAWGTLLECLSRLGRLEAGFVVHSFSGAPDVIPALAAFGARFSFSGSVTYPGNRRARKALVAVPLDRLLIETDAPDIPPYPGPAPEGPALQARKPLNEPANLARVFRVVVELRHEGEARLEEQLWRNAQELFGEP